MCRKILKFTISCFEVNQGWCCTNQGIFRQLQTGKTIAGWQHISSRGWRKPGSFIKMERTGKAFLVIYICIYVYMNTWCDQDMALPGRDTSEQEQEETSWSCLGMLSRKRDSFIWVSLCIYPHLKVYTFLQTRAKPWAALQTPPWFIDWLIMSAMISESIFLRRRHALTVADGALSHKIDYATIF